tara:strand:- start:2192 stop:2866 length:675 start_codon:yes stop_codon:yes gene_type:complete
MKEKIHKSWEPFFKSIDTDKLDEFLDFIKSIDTCPKHEDIFNVLKMPLDDIKVIIIGQDPYHTVFQHESEDLGQSVATGYSFAVNSNYAKIPPSLKNIFNCVAVTTHQLAYKGDPTLQSWIDQGVFLLNRALTTEQGKAGAHLKYWKWFTDALIEYINANREGIVFLLWGKRAELVNKFIDEDRHTILTYSHPSPLSRKQFVFCPHFVLTNMYLKEQGKNQIQW